jgi:large subunit ribosomal protein L23
MKLTDIVLSPVITEKSTNLAKDKIYTFLVSNDSNKFQIAKTLEKVYGVEVKTVRITGRKGKEKRVGRRMMTKTMTDSKFAYVTLKKGVIDIFPQS